MYRIEGNYTFTLLQSIPFDFVSFYESGFYHSNLPVLKGNFMMLANKTVFEFYHFNNSQQKYVLNYTDGENNTDIYSVDVATFSSDSKFLLYRSSYSNGNIYLFELDSNGSYVKTIISGFGSCFEAVL